MKTYVEGTHNICFCREIRKICGYPLLSVALTSVCPSFHKASVSEGRVSNKAVCSDILFFLEYSST